MKLLASLCNRNAFTEVSERKHLLLEVDLSNLQVSAVTLTHPALQACSGGTGLASFRDGYLLATQGSPSRLVYLDRQYRVLDVWPLEVTRDAHSLLTLGDSVFLASTGNDALVHFDPGKGETLVWGGDDDTDDRIHLNSVTLHETRLVVSAFGRKRNPFWLGQPAEGYLLDINSGERIFSGLHHPHSLLSHEGHFYFCDSLTRQVRDSAGGRLSIQSGYTRGLAITANRLYVGTSRLRKWSRSKGDLLVHDDMTGECRIQVYQRSGSQLTDARLVEGVALGRYADEIYDLLLVDR